VTGCVRVTARATQSVLRIEAACDVRCTTLHTGPVTPRPRRAVLATLAAVALLSAACTGGKDSVDQAAGGQFRYVSANSKGSVIPAAKRKMAGPVRGELLSGGQYALSQDRGKTVVLNFMASWCGPCQTEAPQFDALYQQRKSAGVQFVGLDVKDASRSASASWVHDKGITFPVVYDEPAKTALQLGDVPIAGLPATVLVDRQGRVAAVYSGQVLPKDLTPALDALAAES
jgi:thiol-disulfide isomerase/thioredoxin